MSKSLPACGIYRTLTAIESVPAGRLVYFHNHGDPGPGVYLPERWVANRAVFSERGQTAPAGFDPQKALRPLPQEGFYRVIKEFHCCAKLCTKFTADTLVQLGYNGSGQAIVFTPELNSAGIGVPERGSAVDDDMLGNLAHLQIREAQKAQGQIAPFPRGVIMH